MCVFFSLWVCVCVFLSLWVRMCVFLSLESLAQTEDIIARKFKVSNFLCAFLHVLPLGCLWCVCACVRAGVCVCVCVCACVCVCECQVGIGMVVEPLYDTTVDSGGQRSNERVQLGVLVKKLVPEGTHRPARASHSHAHKLIRAVRARMKGESNQRSSMQRSSKHMSSYNSNSHQRQ